MCFLFFQKAPLTHDPEFPCFIGTKGHIFQVEEPILKHIKFGGMVFFFTTWQAYTECVTLMKYFVLNLCLLRVTTLLV